MTLYDLICIGAGSGGIASAVRAAIYGKKVAIIESGHIGGTCVNVGCVPKKVMWYAADFSERSLKAKDYGFNCSNMSFDWQTLVKHREVYIGRLRFLYKKRFESLGIDHYAGFGKFIASQKIIVDDQTILSAKQIIIATGGEPIMPEIPGATLGIDSDGFFELQQLPKKTLVVGAGYIALELAGILASLGCDTFLSIRYDRPLRHFDHSLTDLLLEVLKKQKVTLLKNTHVTSVSCLPETRSIDEKRSDQRVLSVTFGVKQRMDDLDAVIWAIGRKPKIADLNLEKIGIHLNKDGFIKVNTLQETSVKNVYAIGDVTGKDPLTPVAIAIGRRLADHLFYQRQKALNVYTDVPTVVFSHPPIATIGLTELQARKCYGDAIKIYQSQFNPMLDALSQHKIPTRMKLIVSTATEKILGIHMIGYGVDEILQGFAVAMRMGATKQDLDNTLAIHPTSAEELVTMR